LDAYKTYVEPILNYAATYGLPTHSIVLTNLKVFRNKLPALL